MTTVSVGGIEFTNDPQAVDADGIRWVLSTLDGWDDGLPVKGNSTDRPEAHGIFTERAWRGARVTAVAGTVLCPTRAAAAVVKRRLAALLADGTFDDLSVADEDAGTLSASVRLAMDPQIDWFVPTAVAYEFRFLSPDPLRYGAYTTATTEFPTLVGGLEYDLYTDGAGADLGELDYGEASGTGRATLTNTGTAASWPQFEITGPVDAAGCEIVVVGTGERLVYAGGVPVGSRLVLDSATGAVLMDGESDRANLLTWRDWWSVPAGGSVEFAFINLGPSSAGTVTASVRPAFW